MFWDTLFLYFMQKIISSAEKDVNKLKLGQAYTFLGNNYY